VPVLAAAATGGAGDMLAEPATPAPGVAPSSLAGRPMPLPLPKSAAYLSRRLTTVGPGAEGRPPTEVPFILVHGRSARASLVFVLTALIDCACGHTPIQWPVAYRRLGSTVAYKLDCVHGHMPSNNRDKHLCIHASNDQSRARCMHTYIHACRVIQYLHVAAPAPRSDQFGSAGRLLFAAAHGWPSTEDQPDYRVALLAYVHQRSMFS